MPRNEFKRRLVTGELQIGLWVSLADPTAAEIAAGAGFDWLLIDGEHAPNDLRTILHQLQAVAAYPVSPIVRPARGEAASIKQLLDLGAQTLLVPMVETPDQAEHLVRCVRYPPAGLRGVATARAARWGRVEGYWATADAETCLVVQIETPTGLANLDAIAAVDGVDAVFVGPSDLAAALGHLGAAGHRAVREVVVDAIGAIRRSGKAAGVLSVDPSTAREYVEAGVSFVGVGVDTLLLARATAALAAEFRAR